MTSEPAASVRLGPGPITASAVRQLDLAVARRVRDLWPGDRQSTQLGPGTELAQIRPYAPGDDVRHLDAAASARTGAPQVRVHVAERALTTWLVLDRSASMGFGTADRVKADVAEGAATAVAALATRRGNHLGVVTYGDPGHPKVIRPRSGRSGFLSSVTEARADVAADQERDTSTLAQALRAVDRAARMPSFIVIVGDIREADDALWANAVRRLGHRHSIVALEVGDPRETELPAVGAGLSLVDPETGRHVRVDTGSRRLRARFAQAAQQERIDVRALLTRSGAQVVTLSTSGDWLGALAAGLHGARHRSGWRSARGTVGNR